jgi:hypothetical protein
MAYGTLKVDNLTYTSGGADTSVTVSGIVGIAAGNFTNVTASNTVSGATITGNTAQFTTATAVTGVFTTSISGATITGNAGQFTTATAVTGIFTTLVSGATVTGNAGQFGTITGNTAGFTTVTGTTVTGDSGQFTTATAVTGIFTTQISGAAITGDSGNFTTLTGVSGTFVTGIFNSGIKATGYIDISGYYISNVRSVDALEIDCISGNYFTKTITGDSTFTVANAPAAGAYALTLEVQHSGGTITWFSGVEWPASTAPTLTSGKTHLFFFVTDDGGSRWRGSSLVDYAT